MTSSHMQSSILMLFNPENIAFGNMLVIMVTVYRFLDHSLGNTVSRPALSL